MLGKIFGQNASGENGLSVFSRHAAMALKNQYKSNPLWEIAFTTGLGALLGCFIGAGIAAGVSYAKDGTLAVKQETAEAVSAPGAVPGAAAGGAALFYYFFMHSALTQSWHETRRQIADNQPVPKL